MKARSNLFLIGWAVGGIGLAVAFFVAWFKSGGDNPLSSYALLGCVVWNVLLWRLMPRK